MLRPFSDLALSLQLLPVYRELRQCGEEEELRHSVLNSRREGTWGKRKGEEQLLQRRGQVFSIRLLIITMSRLVQCRTMD